MFILWKLYHPKGHFFFSFYTILCKNCTQLLYKNKYILDFDLVHLSIWAYLTWNSLQQKILLVLVTQILVSSKNLYKSIIYEQTFFLCIHLLLDSWLIIIIYIVYHVVIYILLPKHVSIKHDCTHRLTGTNAAFLCAFHVSSFSSVFLIVFIC